MFFRQLHLKFMCYYQQMDALPNISIESSYFYVYLQDEIVPDIY